MIQIHYYDTILSAHHNVSQKNTEISRAIGHSFSSLKVMSGKLRLASPHLLLDSNVCFKVRSNTSTLNITYTVIKEPKILLWEKKEAIVSSFVGKVRNQDVLDLTKC